ncbi:MAG: HIT domain-containing protein [candidate division WOR-3 bacterium]
MKQIWAPWRMQYIKQCQTAKTKNDGCFLCLPNKKNSYVVYQGKYCYIMLNRFPYNPGHLMIVPYRHLGSIEQLSESESQEMFQLMNYSISALKQTMKPEGFNIGINIGNVAGAGVPDHIHIHLVPRWLGDTNFLPVLTDTKIINQALKDTKQKLKKIIKSIVK